MEFEAVLHSASGCSFECGGVARVFFFRLPLSCFESVPFAIARTPGVLAAIRSAVRAGTASVPSRSSASSLGTRTPTGAPFGTSRSERPNGRSATSVDRATAVRRRFT